CGGNAEEARGELMDWALAGTKGTDTEFAGVDREGSDITGADGVQEVLAALAEGVRRLAGETSAQVASEDGIDALRLSTLAKLFDAYPGDPGIFVSLLLHLERLQPGEAIYLGARQLHAYLSGIAVE